MTTVSYEADIVAWANEQAWLVRNKKFELLDIEHIAEEIEDKSRADALTKEAHRADYNQTT